MAHGAMCGITISFPKLCKSQCYLAVLPVDLLESEGKFEWTHEQGSEMMFEAMIAENRLDITEEEQTLIKALIAGEHERVP